MSMHTTQAQVESITPLTDSIIQLHLNPQEYIPYQAGQYLNIHLENEVLSYSIANAPLGSHKYELHIRHSAENNSNQKLLAHIKEYGQLCIKLPYGNCSLDNMDPDRPILFIAGGTGFAPVKAMIEQLLAQQDPRQFELFWGARSQSDLYMEATVTYWQQHVSRFNYSALISETKKISLVQAVLDKHAQGINAWQIVLSGPFDRVYRLRDELVEHGVDRANLYSDAFSFENQS